MKEWKDLQLYLSEEIGKYLSLGEKNERITRKIGMQTMWLEMVSERRYCTKNLLTL
jgi:hypothetical protein